MASEAPCPSNSAIAGLRARLKSCCAIVSNIQPELAMARTNQWYEFSSRYQGPLETCRPASIAAAFPSSIGGNFLTGASDSQQMLGEGQAGFEVFSLSICQTLVRNTRAKFRRRPFFGELQEANELPGW